MKYFLPLMLASFIQVGWIVSIHVPSNKIPDAIANYNCREITKEKNKCVEGENTLLGWRTIKFAASDNYEKLHTNVTTCQIRCVEDPKCVVVNFIGEMRCGLATYNRISPQKGTSFILNCCQKNIEAHEDEAYLCDRVTEEEKSKKKCKANDKFLSWKTETSSSFNSESKFSLTPDECRRRCAADPKCDQVTFNNQNECWFGWKGAIYQSANYITSILKCCQLQPYNIPFNLDRTYNCDRVMNWNDIKCSQQEEKYLVWKSHGLEKTSFNSNWKIKASPKDCRIICRNDPNCNQIAYNRENECLLGSSINTYKAESYTTAFLYCCELEKKVKVTITTGDHLGRSPWPVFNVYSNHSVLIEHKQFPECKIYKYVGVADSNHKKKGYKFIFSDYIKHCPRNVGVNDFVVKAKCETIGESNWKILKIEVQIDGEKKFCFGEFFRFEKCNYIRRIKKEESLQKRASYSCH